MAESSITVVEQRGSHQLVRQGARFAVLEHRNGLVYGVHEGARDGYPESAQGIRAAVGADWVGEAEARERFREAVARGEQVAQRLW